MQNNWAYDFDTLEHIRNRMNQDPNYCSFDSLSIYFYTQILDAGIIMPFNILAEKFRKIELKLIHTIVSNEMCTRVFRIEIKQAKYRLKIKKQ